VTVQWLTLPTGIEDIERKNAEWRAWITRTVLHAFVPRCR
jgi:hypothetical protein